MNDVQEFIRDRLQTINDEAFGISETVGIIQNLDRIEEGIAAQRREIDKLRGPIVVCTEKAQFEHDLRALLIKEMRRRKVGRTMVLFHVMHIVNDMCHNRLRFKAEAIVK